MSVLLLTSLSAEMGYTEAVPIRMKAPKGTVLIGFATEELGEYYVQGLGVNRKNYSFGALKSFAEKVAAEEKARERIVYFRTKADVDLHLRDRARFPYDEFMCRLTEGRFANGRFLKEDSGTEG